MKNILSALLFGFLLISFGCNTNKPSDNAQTEDSTTYGETPAEETDDAMANEETDTDNMTGNENYEVTVLKGDLPSPRKEMKGKVGGVDVVVNYGSPSAKGREIWGSLVPYGEVWRAGANEATTVQFSQDAMVEGKKIAAGKYSLFVVPSEGKYTVVFNTVADQWGAYEYDQGKDVLRVEVNPSTDYKKRETMDFMIEGDQVVLAWDTVAVPFTVKAA